MFFTPAAGSIQVFLSVTGPLLMNKDPFSTTVVMR